MKQYLALISLAILAALLLVPMPDAHGATAPVLTKLVTLQNQQYPGKVVADGDGNIYVADAVNRQVRKYTRDGIRVKTIGLTTKPSVMAISPDGFLHVGVERYAQGTVDVFSLDGTYVKTLNTGATPSAIAFLTSGEMLTTDLANYRVKMFDGSMQLIRSFGGYGTVEGSFVDPSALAVNESLGEIYVLDRGQAATESGQNAHVWRVQAFDLNGTFLRAFSHYGYGQDGMVGKASDIVVDSQGRLYVSDSEQNLVMVYDELGTYLTQLYDAQSPVRTPVDMTFINDRLYIASLIGREVQVYGVDAYASLRVTPKNIALSYQQGASAPAGTADIVNDGAGALAWQALPGSSWLSVAPGSGQAAGGSAQSLTVTADGAGMAPGTYEGSIAVTSNGGSDSISVTLQVAPPPVLTVSPTTFSIQKRTNEPVQPLMVSIELGNDLSGSMQWQAASDAQWLSIQPAAGPSNTIVGATLDVSTAMAPGIYTGHVTVAATGAVGSPAVVTVTLELLSSGRIVVTTNAAGASFTITGPVTYSGSGTSAEFTNVSEGDYTITYGSIQGFVAPQSETKALVAGGEIQFSGDYRDLRQQMNIITSHGPGPKESSEIAVYRADGTQALKFVPFSSLYGAATAAGDVDGDGAVDILVGAGPEGSKVSARIKGFRRDGTAIPGLDFLAFTTDKGVLVSAADFDGDGKAEIVAAQAKTNSNVRIFSYQSGTVLDTGAGVTIGGGNSPGVVTAAADLDGDLIPELIVAPRVSTVIPMVEVYRVDTSLGVGSWNAVLLTSFPGCNWPTGTNIDAADTDADGVAEVVVACPSSTGTEIRVLDGQGVLKGSFLTGSVAQDYVAAGDVNMDGAAEIVIGDGPAKGAATVKVFTAGGSMIKNFGAFKSSTGVRVSTGNLGY